MFILSTIYNDHKLLIESVSKVYRPLFAIKKENAKQWFYLSLIILFNTAQAILLVITNTYLNQIFGILSPSLSFTTFLMAALQYLGAVSVFAFTSVTNVFFNGKLTQHLDDVMVNANVKKWLDSNAFLGMNFIPSKKKKALNTAIFFSHDIQKSNSLAVRSFDSLINTILQFFAGLYGLWQLSAPLSLLVASYQITIPALIPIGAIVYSLVYCLIVGRLGYKLRDITRNKKDASNQLEAHSNHIDKNAESIALLRGHHRENRNFLNINKKINDYHVILNRLQSALSCFTIFNDHLQTLFAIALSLPQLISKQLTEGNVLSITNYFSKVVGFFTWQGDNCEDLANLSVLGDKFQSMKEQTAAWEALKNESRLNVLRKGNKLIINDILIKNPNKKDTFLQLKDFEFNKAKVTLIQGPSGIGKTSLFRALAQLWPYVEGKIKFPAEEDETHFIPQKPFFPQNESLFDAITYPHKCKTIEQGIRIRNLIKEFNLHHLISKARESKDWSKILSLGEQQKIALIRAIWHNPKLLFMDEPFSSMDLKSKELCEKRLLAHLPYTTIICIDHQGDSKFYDYLVTFKNHKLTKAPMKPMPIPHEKQSTRKFRKSI